ncbi:MAG TPA: hypothetical protein EYN40_02950 [Planctomycetes bacterium]|nr:hypothetical protein [Planctomycetota bacterium]
MNLFRRLISALKRSRRSRRLLQQDLSRNAASFNAICGDWKTSRPRVLFFSPRAWTTNQALECTLARAVALRGAAVKMVFCDRAMPCCEAITLERWGRRESTCADCAETCRHVMETAGLPLVSLRDHVAPGLKKDLEREVRSLSAAEVFDYASHGDPPLGELLKVPLRRFFRSSDIPVDDPRSVEVIREFLLTGLVARHGARALFEKLQPDVVFMLNGRFAPEAVFLHEAQQAGIRVVTYERGFCEETILIDIDRPAVDYLVFDQMWGSWKDVPLTAEQDKKLDVHLARRFRGSDAAQAIYWSEIQTVSAQEIQETLGLQPGRPLAAMFPNITWDTATQNRDVGFDGLADWLVETVKLFESRPDRDLVIRCHPAEVRLGRLATRESVSQVLAGAFPDGMPDNVKVISPESTLSSYSLGAAADQILVYASTMGLELSTQGKPVLVAGRVHYRGSGFTFDVEHRDSYGELLDSSLAGGLPHDFEQKARRYAYMFFFGAMVPMRAVAELAEVRGAGKSGSKTTVRLRYQLPEDLAPGVDPDLDRLCASIIDGVPAVQMAPIH